ncbi:unnamed protein product [Rhizophagus irregularis]|nr:unnamed protein product [Rhizophagus irregularis]
MITDKSSRLVGVTSEGGFAKVYSATWLHGGKKFIYTDPVTKTKKIRTYPNTVALKSIKGSNEISAEYLNELEVYHKLTLDNVSLPFYGITKDPNSSEFMMVTNLAEQGCLRSLLGESGDDAKKIKVEFDIADKEIPNVQSLFKKSSKDSNLMFVSKQLGFNDIIETSVYDNLDSGLIGLNLSDDIGEDNEDDDNED